MTYHGDDVKTDLLADATPLYIDRRRPYQIPLLLNVDKILRLPEYVTFARLHLCDD